MESPCCKPHAEWRRSKPTPSFLFPPPPLQPPQRGHKQEQNKCFSLGLPFMGRRKKKASVCAIPATRACAGQRGQPRKKSTCLRLGTSPLPHYFNPPWPPVVEHINTRRATHTYRHSHASQRGGVLWTGKARCQMLFGFHTMPHKILPSLPTPSSRPAHQQSGTTSTKCGTWM